MPEHCDLTMKLCNTSDQRGKCSVALNYYALARRFSTKQYWAVSSNAKMLAKYQLSAWRNEQALCGHDNFSSLVQYLQSHLRGSTAPFSPTWLRA